MKKFITSNKIKILIAILAISSLLLPSVGNVAYAATNPLDFLMPEKWLYDVMAVIGETIQRITSSILALIGWWFEFILQKTIADLSQSLGKDGLGGSISAAWGTVRDIANLAFIFVLLYAAVTVIFQAQTKAIGGTIKNIVIIGLLMNFSLFFTKVIIDAGNIPAIGFYNAIVAESDAKPIKVLGDSVSIKPGITNTVMKLTGVHTFWDGQVISYFKSEKEAKYLVFVNGLMSAIFMLILGVVLLVASIMFVARYLLLIFLMVLSPLALIAYILPGAQARFWEWFNSLKNQVLFAPLFFMFLWVAFKVLASMGQGLGKWSSISVSTESAAGLMLNYALVIGFVIMALIASKKMASQSFGFNAVSGAVGAGVIGGAGIVGRNTVGRGANWISETQRERLSKNALGRSILWTANKTKGSSFDVRGLGESKLGKATGAGELFKGMGKVGGKDGFAKTVEKKAEAKAKYAKAVYGQTAAETEAANKLKTEYEEMKKGDESRVRELREKAASNAEKVNKGHEEARQSYADNKLKTFNDNLERLKQEKEAKLKQFEEEKRLRGESNPQTFRLKQEASELEAQQKAEEERLAAAKKELEEKDERYKELKEMADSSKEELLEAQKTVEKEKIDDKEYSQEVRNKKEDWETKKGAGETRMKEYADRVKKSSPVSMTTGTVLGGALGSVLGPVGGAVGAGVGAWVGNKLGSKIPYYWAGNKAAARKVRGVAEGKEDKDKKKLAKEVQKALGIEEKEEEKEGEKKEEGEKTKAA